VPPYLPAGKEVVYPSNVSEAVRRTGSQTRVEAQQVALELFTSQGYEATSLREIAERLGVSKAALYYHFNSKDDIVRSLMAARADEAAELLAWAHAQEPGPERMEQAVLRWVETTSIEKLRGIRFVTANPAVLRNLNSGSLRETLHALAEDLTTNEVDPRRRLLIRMALLSVNSAVMAANGTDATDEEISAAAKQMALALLKHLHD
jgi:AcrR family transcriptional regulator